MTLRLLTLCLFVATSTVQAQDIPTGPDVGKPPPELKVFDATGLNEDKDVDYAVERTGKPTIFVLIDAEKWDRPMARFVRELDKTIQDEDNDEYIVAVWLTDDSDQTKQYLPRAQHSLQLERTALTCFTGDKIGPKGWNINPDAHLTAVVAAKGKVTATYGFRSINELDVPPVLEALKKAAK